MISILAISIALLGAPPAAPDVVVVCPTPFRQALEPWVAYRRAQGHVVEVLAAGIPTADLRAHLQSIHAVRPELTVVLVGDAEPAAGRDAAVAARSVPTFLAPAKVNVLFGSEPEIATDVGYVDFNGDGAPEASVGRLPVDTPEQLSKLVQRIIAYENSTNFGAWRRRINFVAGVGGFGPIADAAIENAAKTLLTRHLPAGLETTMTYAGPASPYYPGSTAFQTTALERFNEGCLMWVYIGHGSRRGLDEIRNPDGATPILNVRHAPALAAGAHPPLACFLSCYSGAFDGEEDCLAEEMLKTDGGPIGVLCGSRVTMPYAMSILGQELMTGFFHNGVPTLGAVLRDAKRNMVDRPRTDAESRQFDAAATMLMPMAADLEAQRREHLYLFNLLGDPLLRMPRPQAVPLTADAEVAAGETLIVRGTSPVAGRALVELVVRRDRLTFLQPDRVPHDRSPAAAGERWDTYHRANDLRLSFVERELPAGPFEVALPVPPTAKGECHVRVYVAGATACGLGSTDVKAVAKRTAE
jgi:hypothetical protein